MTQAIVPSSAQPIADPRTGMVTTYWQRFFNALPGVAAPAAIAAVTVTASPYTYLSGAGGTLSVTGGTVSSITLTRNNVTTATGITSGLVPVANGDRVTITYSGLPTVNFIPA